MMSPAVADITETAYNSTLQPPWVGSVDAERAWRWIDNFLILVSHGGAEGDVLQAAAFKKVFTGGEQSRSFDSI